MTEIFNKKEMKERRQYSVGAYILDFYCPDLRLAIEIDGASHDRPIVKEYDQEREEQIKHLGITIIRFTNSQIETKLKEVVHHIRKTSATLRASQATTFPLVKGKTQKGSKAINMKANTNAN